MKKLLLIIVLIDCLSSCKKDETDSFVPNLNMSINDTAWVNKPLSNGFTDSLNHFINDLPIYTDSFNVVTGRNIPFNNDSLELDFPPYACFTPGDNDRPLNYGNIVVQMIALIKKGDYVKSLISTTSRTSILQSAGSFLVNLSGSGQPTGINRGVSYTIRWLQPNNIQGMTFFEGASSSYPDSAFTFLSSGFGQAFWWDSTSSGVSKQGYAISTPVTSDWLNCSSYLDTSLHTTRLNILLPPNFTNNNTLVFAIGNKSNTVVKLVPEFSTRTFYCLNVPLNMSMTLISISLIDNQFYLGTNSTTISNANGIVINPSKSSAAAIIGYLNNL